ncbi:hypothetical protein SODALDRAFT_296792 [Sodiomyces alkalinus F11]|uniref:lytic cellulose monooxygenase (C4-dehydrogenating) n=1 Tax=Sodiomyces alkalinus (strain CBS 110278 / VKM F-3762 / F11) TaxID=1314773 RepID=A0A3N2PUQ1_SODAK|nr:hypothetical protein SODALDRAFT_296792 [Sodiomyces alkalinus F11]ROT38222.1 hypothetical protein SODALDRAFT_296792 [Sodiomyces alkalinus F11]
MKITALASLAWLAVAPLVSAHYSWDKLIVNGQQRGGDWQYIRQHTRGYMPTKWEEILRPDFRCNDNALSGARTQVYTVRPGDRVAVRQAFGANSMEHPGPTQVYLSRAPGSVQSYDGSGDWFKVHQSLVCRQRGPNGFQTDAWCMWGENTIEFTVPSNIPTGEYLARYEHIALHGAHGGEAEFYYACAQLRVEGTSASSIPGPTARIPGVYGTRDPAVNFSVWNGPTRYPHIPGIAVVPGGTIRGNDDGSVGFRTITVSGGGSPPPSNPPPSTPPPPPPPPSSGGAPLYGQCGGEGWDGPRTCAQGTCREQNPWYSQCL